MNVQAYFDNICSVFYAYPVMFSGTASAYSPTYSHRPYAYLENIGVYLAHILVVFEIYSHKHKRIQNENTERVQSIFEAYSGGI